MYSIYDVKAKIKEIQKYLFITESGNYDDKTREAIILAQKNNGIKEDGKIDSVTFDIIYKEHEKARQKDEINNLFPRTAFPLRLYDYNEAIMEINKMLVFLSDFYGIQTNLRISDHYSERTEDVLSQISDIYTVKRDFGEISEDIYMMLKKDYDGIRMSD